MKSAVILFLILVTGLAAVFFSKHVPASEKQISEVLPKIISSPTPMPFVEMTIPYLRQRTYTSSLGTLEQYSQTNSFTTYLTTYTSDNLTIHGLLTKPNGTMPKGGWPAIVFVHGYIPPSLYKTTERYEDYINFLAKNNFVVFKIDLRGNGDSQGQAGGSYFSADYVIDTLNAVAALKQSSFVNDKQIGLWGHSMAGNITMRAAVVQKDIPAIVIWAGAVYSYLDQRTYGIQDLSYRPPPMVTQQQSSRQKLMDLYGPPSTDSSFWKQMAPINYLADLQGAVEIHHAKDDSVVTINYSRDLIKELDKTTVPHEFFEYDSGGHNINGVSFGVAMQRTVEFYQKYLLQKK